MTVSGTGLFEHVGGEILVPGGQEHNRKEGEDNVVEHRDPAVVDDLPAEHVEEAKVELGQIVGDVLECGVRMGRTGRAGSE